MRLGGSGWAIWAFTLVGCSSGQLASQSSGGSVGGSGGQLDVAALSGVDAGDGGQDGASVPADATDLVEHNIVRQTCQSERFSQAFIIEPGLVCAWKPGSRTERMCTPGVECVRPEDCGGQPFTRCTGSGQVSCSYPVPADESCQIDGDCNALPGGRCLPPFGSELLCTPTGGCEPQTPFCDYPVLRAPCQSDAECTAAAGGYCKSVIDFTTCNTSAQCVTDADCPAGQRCACGVYNTAMVCVDAECKTDGDCGVAGLCLRANPCGGGEQGPYYCSTPSDECHSNQDCPGGAGYSGCAYSLDERRWRCEATICESP
jgi:hypothetical protein